ncbi:prepilin-type N-terminal cleavage/methylation domain-containing protein [Ferrovibrio sp.]|uniref:prepilin-type N-terminal cleavage/methylation domain-containing protein n=1 Tax=Ferrovibrio sp. TaxID=1917215 RepID=UPI0025B9F68E|nr:prepilin-type N-terminal cleavage/methylation domain-containing protein [Ferrovibrio sp.]MBX3456029.1 prepilin-type N-terminal cleavage/methylation domain-containing protein [Ferrovibrio sp.]
MKKAAGFTLVELLVALAITALAALLLAGALRGNLDSLRRVERHADASEALRESMHLLRRLLHAAPPIGRIERGRLNMFFEGDAMALTLPLETARGLELGRFDLQGDVLRFTLLPPPFPGGAAADNPESVALLHDAASLRFAYHDGRQWHEDWLGREYLPAAVRVDVQRKDGASLPPLIVDIAAGILR